MQIPDKLPLQTRDLCGYVLGLHYLDNSKTFLKDLYVVSPVES